MQSNLFIAFIVCDMDAGDPAPSVVPVLASRYRSGHEKRREKNRLPKVFLLYSRAQRSIIGASIFEAVRRVGESSDVVWFICRPVRLVVPFALDGSQCEYMSSVFQMGLPAELQVRALACEVGGSIISHFLTSLKAASDVSALTRNH